MHNVRKFFGFCIAVGLLAFVWMHARGQNIQNIPTPSLYVNNGLGRTNVLLDEFAAPLQDEGSGNYLLPEK